MIETIMVMVVFFFILTGGFIYYQRFSERGQAKRSSDSIRSRALQISRIALNLPELQCSSENIIQDNCVDRLKIAALEDILLNDRDLRLRYAEMFSFGKITVEQIYPVPFTYEVYPERKPPGGIIFSEVMHIPVNIYDPLYQGGTCLSFRGGCHFGVLIVEVYR